jgi:hypothetical protein
MIFSIRDLSFELGSVLLEGWFAQGAHCSFCLPHGWYAAG